MASPKSPNTQQVTIYQRGLELTGVQASVVGNQKAPLLLEQTVLKRIGKIEIDNERRVLKITTNK